MTMACVRWLDQPVASYLAELSIVQAGSAFGAQLRMPLRLAIFGLALVGALAGSMWSERNRSSQGAQALLESAWVATLSLLAAVALQYVVGRSQLELFLAHNLTAFRPLAGAPMHAALPSASAAMTVGTCLVLMRRIPGSRPAVYAGAALVTLGLLVAGGHWLGDIVAGSTLGLLVADRRTAARFRASPVAA